MAGLASLLRRRQAYGPTMGSLTGGGGRSVRPRIRRTILRKRPSSTPAAAPVYPANAEPPGGKHGGLLGYQGGGRTMNPRAGGAAARRELLRRKYQHQVPTVPQGLNPDGTPYVSPLPPAPPPRPGGWQKGGEVETDSYGKYTIARGSGAARPQKFRKNG